MAFYKPIVTTDFSAAYEKVIDGKNGLITRMEPHSIAAGVEKLLTSEETRCKFIEYQKEHPLSYDEEMNKFYDIINQNLKSK